MKHLRATAKSGMASKLARMRGNESHDIGRNSDGMARKAYARGGVISGEGNMDVDGVGAKSSLGKPSRMKGSAKGGKDGKKGTNVNVIVMPKGGDAPPAAGPMPPPPGPPMPPPGPMAGGPPMPMRARGGRVESKGEEKKEMKADEKSDKKMISSMIHKHEKAEHGGKLTKFKSGGGIKNAAGGGLGRLAKIKAYGPKAGKAC